MADGSDRGPRGRITIAGIMGSVLIAALGLAAYRALLPEGPEARLLVGLALLVLAAAPVLALGIAAFARWAFTPPPGAGVPPDDE